MDPLILPENSDQWCVRLREVDSVIRVFIGCPFVYATEKRITALPVMGHRKAANWLYTILPICYLASNRNRNTYVSH